MAERQQSGGATASARSGRPVGVVGRKIARVWADFEERYRDYGLFRTVHSTVFRRLKRLGLHLFLVELGDDDPNIEPPVLPPGYTTRPIALEALWPWVGVADTLTADFLQGAIARGDRCVANFHDGHLVGHGFVARERAPVTDQIEVVVDPWLIYRYKGWTHPGHRRKHLSHARGRINRQLFPLRDGMRTVDYVDVDNLASRLKHRDLRPVRLGYCGFVRIFGREIPFTGRVPRRFGFRLARR